jgi:hypothetical protein
MHEHGDVPFLVLQVKEHVYVFFYLKPLNAGLHRIPIIGMQSNSAFIRLCGQCSAWHIPIIGITPMHLLKGMSKKRHTRAPYEIHALEGIKKRHPHAHTITKHASLTLKKGDE